MLTNDELRRPAPSPDPPPATTVTGSVARPPINALTGLRFAAALLVAFSHFPELIPIAGAAVPLERQGAAGVTIFFVLSGFVLTYRYFDDFRHGTSGVTTFLRARLARIAPMSAVALLVVTPIVLLVSTARSSVLSWFVNLFMLQSLIPTKGMNSWNIPAWSVSAELIFYVVFPFFIWGVLARVGRRRLLALAGVLFAIEVALFCAVAVVAERRLTAGGKAQEDINDMLARFKFFPGLRIWEFFLGCVLGAVFLYARSQAGRGWWSWLDRRRVRNGCIAVAGLGLVAILFVPSLVELPTSGLAAQLSSAGLYLAYTPLAVLLVLALAWGPTTVSPILEHRYARALGDASYSFYLLQWALVLIAVESSWAPQPRTWWFSGIGIGLLIVVSLLSARWIEVPARRLIRGRRGRDRASVASVSAVTPPAQ